MVKIDYVHDKGSGKLNEDQFIIKNNLYGVFDGATSLNKYIDENGKTGGFIASSTIKEIFEENKNSLEEMAIKANLKLNKLMLSKNIDISEKINLWGTTAAVVRLNKNYFEWLQIGDSLIMIIYRDNKYEILTKNYDHDKETMILWKELANKKIFDISDKLKEQIIKVRKKANISYGVINGEKEMKSFLNTGKKELKNVKYILTFTDGLFIPNMNPEESDDFDIFVKLFLDKGLKNILSYIRNLEKDDINCWRYPRFKQHDDITGISISL